ncbi:M23 family metallopeptidase [Labilibaculum filiforme]|uniref:M23 family metallopeptidase n=1 Tax=Labilibaculum filiforme TaxID=1940526 RepID=UPI0015D5A2FD|nr:M23 family metallopeptidase [Labilibaculum filiforme]
MDSLILMDDMLYQNNWNQAQINYPANLSRPKDEILVIKLVSNQDNPFTIPHKGKVISKFGIRNRRLHTGTDIRLNSGDTVVCAFDGRVRMAKISSGYGNMVVVRHKNGLETLYSHLKTICVQVNDTILSGELIGLGGRTGHATCNHLHFETRLLGQAFDSDKYIDFETSTLKSNLLYYKNRQFEIDFAKLKVPASKNQHSISAPNNPDGIYMIQKGDTLWNIAKKHNTSVSKICTDNRIAARTILKIGDALKIN